ncbi:hypothetical protein AGMMS49974_07300 [Deltaproteobacteria bacterium]|nr:hypothetical protein AGMMS49925_06110 [Deltaproteobacteria bacterium]GHU95561.1 hypothetical protein AGMMS49974_07300 [Deltaproteobacteria bacterium]GHV00413.1 hypothetical protein AGMMS50248_10070 [Deltaproteobacteria bacterium]
MGALTTGRGRGCIIIYCNNKNYSKINLDISTDIPANFFPENNVENSTFKIYIHEQNSAFLIE